MGCVRICRLNTTSRHMHEEPENKNDHVLSPNAKLLKKNRSIDKLSVHQTEQCARVCVSKHGSLGTARSKFNISARRATLQRQARAHHQACPNDLMNSKYVRARPTENRAPRNSLPMAQVAAPDSLWRPPKVQ